MSQRRGTRRGGWRRGLSSEIAVPVPVSFPAPPPASSSVPVSSAEAAPSVVIRLLPWLATSRIGGRHPGGLFSRFNSRERLQASSEFCRRPPVRGLPLLLSASGCTRLPFFRGRDCEDGADGDENDRCRE